jgi:hypothetical protein
MQFAEIKPYIRKTEKQQEHCAKRLKNNHNIKKRPEQKRDIPPAHEKDSNRQSLETVNNTQQNQGVYAYLPDRMDGEQGKNRHCNDDPDQPFRQLP